MQVKICGLKYRENIQQLALLQPGFMGFIFYKGSERYVGEDFDESITWNLPAAIKKVGVFVNETEMNILEIVARYNLDLVQLHGEETPEFCAELKKYVPVIKAFHINEQFDFRLLGEYRKSCSCFLFDTKGEGYGGTGKKFNWDLLQQHTIEKPYFLSGGIDTTDIEQLRYINPFAIDINSRFEEAPGMKNIEKTKELILKTIEHALQR